MKPPDQALRDLVRKWLAKAESDRDLAELIAGQGVHFDAVGFHAQQAVEKYLKALLTQHRVDFPRTHDLRLLLNLAGEFDPALADSLREVTSLSPYGAGLRYPTDAPEPTGPQAAEAVRLANKAKAEILGRLRDVV